MSLVHYIPLYVRVKLVMNISTPVLYIANIWVFALSHYETWKHMQQHFVVLIYNFIECRTHWILWSAFAILHQSLIENIKRQIFSPIPDLKLKTANISLDIICMSSEQRRLNGDQSFISNWQNSENQLDVVFLLKWQQFVRILIKQIANILLLMISL